MKTIVFSFFFIFGLLDVSIAQQKMGAPLSKAASENCIGTSQNPLPYSPRFGSTHDTTSEVKKWGFGFYNEAYSIWSFQTISASDTALAPFFHGSPSAISVPIFFPCFQMESEKTYRLDFTYVGLTAGKSNTLRLVATQIVNGRYDEKNLIPLGTLTGLNSGSSQQNIVLDKHNLSGNYHLGLICDNFGTDNIFYLKNIRLSELSSYDLSLLGFESPLSQCEINNQKVRLSLQNLGSATPSSYRICYTISDGENTNSTPHCESFSQAIPLNAKASIAFASPIQVGSASQVSIRAWIDNTYADGNTENDSLPSHIVRRFDQITPPYRCDFSSHDNLRQWTSISPNKPGAKAWEINILNAEGSAVLHTDVEAADDWLISSCVALKKDSLYRFRVHYQSLGTLPENLKLKVGNESSPSGLSVLLQEVRGFSNTQKQVLDAYYKAPADGNYFFGLHAQNELPGTGIRIRQIEISSTAPLQLPLYRSFESFESVENTSAWMSISRNNNIWSDTSGWQSNTALRSSFKASDSNLLCSPPLYLESGKTYEIVYARKANSNSRELLHLLLGQSHLLSNLKTHSVLLRDSLPLQNTWNLKTHYFQVKQSGVYFLAFQYAQGSKGFAIDEVALRDSLTGSKPNISVLNLEIPKTSCRLGKSEKAILTLKNHSAATVVGSSISAVVEVNGTKLSPSATNTLKAYEIITKEFSGLDLNKDTLYNIRAWINHANDINRSDDTSATLQTERIKPFTGLLQTSFENDADNRRWTITSEGSGTYTSWTFPSMPNNAYSGTRVAYLANPQVVNSTKDYLISPCLSLSADTTYLVAFYYKVVDPLKSDSLSLVWGSVPSSLLPVTPTIRVENNEYKRLVRYIRPAYSETLYVGIRAESQKLKGGMIIDDFVIVDSLTAAIPKLALKGASLASSRSCDLSADTLKVVLKNKGFFDYSQAKVTILFSDGSLKTESLAGTIAPGKEKAFVLQNLWQHSQWGRDSIRILLDIAKDTSDFLFVEKYPAAEVPYTVNFQNPQIYQTWNLASQSEKASFGGDSCRYFTIANGKASFANGTAEEKSGLLLSHCFLLNASDGPFRISFSYRATNAVQKEKMEVFLLHPQGKKILLGTLNDFSNTDYSTYRIALDSLPTGAYKIAFYSPFHRLAKGIDIAEFVACPDTSRWPADVRVKRIILPSSNLNPSSTESIGVVLENANKKPLKNIAVTLTHQDHIYTETIAAINPGDSIRYTFSHTLDLSSEGEHTLYVFTAFPGDINLRNDTIKGVFNSQLSSDLSVEEILLPATPLDELTASENITVVVKNKNRKTLENAKVFLRIDQANPLQSPIRSLNSNDTAHCLFTALDFSTEKTYAILAYVALSEDVNRSNDSLRKMLTHAPTSLQHQQEEATIKIYPNPARQRVFVESSENLKNIELFNVSGQSLERLVTPEKTASLDVSRHKAGVYFLRITTARGSFTKSLVITRE